MQIQAYENIDPRWLKYASTSELHSSEDDRDKDNEHESQNNFDIWLEESEENNNNFKVSSSAMELMQATKSCNGRGNVFEGLGESGANVHIANKELFENLVKLGYKYKQEIKN